jgi:hypothetical protein
MFCAIQSGISWALASARTKIQFTHEAPTVLKFHPPTLPRAPTPWPDEGPQSKSPKPSPATKIQSRLLESKQIHTKIPQTIAGDHGARHAGRHGQAGWHPRRTQEAGRRR